MSQGKEFSSEHDAIWTLKDAVATFQRREITWKSIDDEYVYTANSPLDPDVDPVTFGDMMYFDAVEVLNGWFIRRINIGRIGVRSALQSTRYTVAAHTPLSSVDWETPASLFDSRVTDPLAHIEDKRNFLASYNEPKEPVVQDFANLDNAIYDLKEIIRSTKEARQLERLMMTPEDLFRERELKREWAVEPERNETGEPLWWHISTLSALFVIYANTAEEAIQAVEDEFYEGKTPPFYQLGMFKEDQQPEYEKYSGRKVVRLIPFTTDEFIVPIPEAKEVVANDPLEKLLESLSFPDSDALKEHSNAIVELLLQEGAGDEDILRNTWAEYSRTIESIVESADELFVHFQIAAIIHKAMIFRATGDMSRYIEELRDAATYSFNENLDEITQSIEEEIAVALLVDKEDADES